MVRVPLACESVQESLTQTHRPGDNVNNCALGYGCPDPALSLDPFVPAGNRFIDVAAGGPTPFTFAVTSNVSWLHVSPAKGSVSPTAPEQRVHFSVNWDVVTGAEVAQITFIAAVKGQQTVSVNATFTANHTVVPVGFTGGSSGSFWRLSLLRTRFRIY